MTYRTERLGFLNHWVDPHGNGFSCSNHLDFAASLLGVAVPESQLDRDFWDTQGKVYQSMYARGWMRVSTNGASNKMSVAYGRFTRGHRLWIEQMAKDGRYLVLDDQDRVFFDFRENANPGVAMAAALVDRLLA